MILETHYGLYAAVRLGNCHAGVYINPVPVPVLLLPTAHIYVKVRPEAGTHHKGNFDPPA